MEASFRVLQKRASSDPEWHAFQCALGETEETRTINVAKSADFSSFLRPNDYSLHEFAGASVIVTQEVVEVRRLDAILPHHIDRAGRAFLKIDTQGWDMHVLRGATGCLDRILGLQLEVGAKPIYEDGPSDYLDVIRAVRELGFEVTGLFPIYRDERMRVIEFDCIMVSGGFPVDSGLRTQ